MPQGYVSGPTPKKAEGRMALGVATAMPLLRAAQLLLSWESVLAERVSARPDGQFQQDLKQLKRAVQQFAEWVDRENDA